MVIAKFVNRPFADFTDIRLRLQRPVEDTKVTASCINKLAGDIFGRVRVR